MNKKLKAFSLFISTVLFIMILLSWYTLKAYEEDKENKIENSLISESNLLFNYLDTLLKQGYYYGKDKREAISYRLENMYQGDLEKLAADLDNYNEPNNPIRTIIAEVKEGFYFYGIVNFSNDMFSVIGYSVGDDDSGDCATFGENRPFFDEYKMHANPYLAKNMLPKISNGSAIGHYSIDNMIFFQFKTSTYSNIDLQSQYSEEFDIIIPADHMNKKALVLDTYDYKGLKKKFFETGDWRHVFESFEFIIPTYLYEKTDLAGRPYVENGINTGIKRFAINITFNFKSIIDKNPNLKKDLARYEWQRTQIIKQYNFQKRTIYILAIMFGVILIITMNTTLKIAQESDNNELHNNKSD